MEHHCTHPSCTANEGLQVLGDWVYPRLLALVVSCHRNGHSKPRMQMSTYPVDEHSQQALLMHQQIWQTHQLSHLLHTSSSKQRLGLEMGRQR